MSEQYEGRQFVGIDLHRRRSVIVRTAEGGDVLECVRISNGVDRLAAVMARAGESPEVVLEATYGWYWAVDALQELGAHVHLAHPLGVKAFEYRRVKNDQLTELPDRVLGTDPGVGLAVARLRAHGQRRGCAAGVVAAGGAAAWVAQGDGGPVRAVPAGRRRRGGGRRCGGVLR